MNNRFGESVANHFKELCSRGIGWLVGLCPVKQTALAERDLTPKGRLASNAEELVAL